MAAFRFRLQKLLDLATTRRQERARELGLARASEVGAERELDRSRQTRLSHLDALRGVPAQGSVDLDAWSAGWERYRNLRGDETAAAARLHTARTAVTTAQGAFVQARQEDGALQRLRDRRQQTWREGQAASEQAVLDEVAGRMGGDAGKGRA